ncbi:MAG TPA: G8 domain-containing protein, partial [Oligoflexus sp.]|uniref:G8 domain-containing protein n=1 Tax=Oligoflexus sp. TaxID=1971216 RepID=UPI002D2F32E5
MKVSRSAFLSMLGFLVLVFTYNHFRDICSLAEVCETQVVSNHDHAAVHSGEAVLFELGRLRLSSATHVAVSNGQWSDPGIWSTQEVPGHGARVYIPHRIDVIYDIVSEDPLKWILVDGLLTWSPVQNTRLVVDTIISGPESQILIGRENEPVLAEADIIFKHDPLDSSWDPDQLSQGLIITGRLSVYGQSKSSFVPALGAAKSGESSVKLSNIPSHWQVGDRIVLTGTRWVQQHWNGFEYEDPETEDEERIIVAIEGRHLTLDIPLSYTHEPADPRFSFHVANLSRSVRFRSALGANTPLGERGHVMLLNPKAAHIFYAGFHHLGRVETGPDNDINNAVSGTPNSAGSIPKGRYPLQVLKTIQQTADPTPVLIHGIAIVESPSLGVALSGSGVVENSVSYNVSGSHFVAHKGFEGGTFRNNMAIRSVGGIHLEGLVEMETLSQGGNGFWIGSRNVVMEGNLVSGARHAGIVYALEPETERGNLSYRSPVQSLEVESYEELQLPVHKQLTVYASRL